MFWHHLIIFKNMKNLLSISLIGLLIFTNCSKASQAPGTTVRESYIVLNEADTIYSSDEHYITDLDVKRGYLLLQLINERDAFIVMKLDDSKKEILATIETGQGPYDIKFGTIMKTLGNSNDSVFFIKDGGIGKIINIEVPSMTRANIMNPDILHMRGTSFNDSILVGHSLESPYQFSIKKGDCEVVNVDNYLFISDNLKNKFEAINIDYLMSTCYVVNPDKNRILSFSYFFDNILAYDLDGNLLKSNRKDKDVSDEFNEIYKNGNYILHTLPFATEEECYIMAVEHTNNNAGERYLLKLNWDGDILKTYKLPENSIGSYAIVGGSTLYCILRDTTDDNETYHVVTYNLQDS